MTTPTAPTALAQLFAAADAIGSKYQDPAFDQAIETGDLDGAISLALAGADEAKALATQAIAQLNADQAALAATTDAVLAKYQLL